MGHGETIILGVLNLTPDSFSDGSTLQGVDDAVARAKRMVRAGASVIDVGGESTRPGATLVGAAEEQRRVLPVIRRLAAEGIPMSIDTINASTAEAAVLAGARTVNDVSGGLHDEHMLATVARLSANIDVNYIVGHWRGIPDPHHVRSEYDDVVTDVRDALAERTGDAIAVGIPRERIIIDPGLGFDKTADQCWEILRRLDELQELGFPVCVGVSRKRMLADIVHEVTGESATFADRDLATSVVSALAARQRVWAVRVHSVEGSAQALKIARHWPGNEASVRPSAAMPNPLDRMSLTGLEVFAHHGVFEFERQQGQRFLIDVEIDLDTARAARSDNLADTLHYGELADRIVEAVRRDPVDLIETLAERVVQVVFGFPSARSVRVTVHKPEAPIDAVFADVSVTVERSRP